MSQYVFGVDIGGTTVKLGYFDTEGNVLDKWEIPTRKEDNGSRILPDVAASIEKKIKDAGIDRKDVAGVGVGAPGPVDSEGVIYKTANLGWGVFSIKETLENILKLPVMAGNDANVAALGEMWKGGGQGYKDLVVVTLGTGVGGGIIVNGKMLTGATEPVVRLDIFMWRMTSRRPAAVETGDVWNSIPLQQVLPVLQSASWKRPHRILFCAQPHFLQRAYLMQ